MQLWKYTDDIAVFIIIGVWALEKITSILRGSVTGVIVEDTYMMLVLGYALGNIVQQAKLSISQ